MLVVVEMVVMMVDSGVHVPHHVYDDNADCEEEGRVVLLFRRGGFLSFAICLLVTFCKLPSMQYNHSFVALFTQGGVGVVSVQARQGLS